jgi:hypothetical protein
VSVSAAWSTCAGWEHEPGGRWAPIAGMATASHPTTAAPANPVVRAETAPAVHAAGQYQTGHRQDDGRPPCEMPVQPPDQDIGALHLGCTKKNRR